MAHPKPPPSTPGGVALDKLVSELVKKIPFIGKVLSELMPFLNKQDRALTKIRVELLEVWKCNKARHVKHEELAGVKKMQARGHRPRPKRIALLERELGVLRNTTGNYATRLRGALLEYERLVKQAYEKQQAFIKTTRKYADDSTRGLKPPTATIKRA